MMRSVADMNREKLIQLSIHIVSEYYRNNLQPFFDVLSDDVLWIGPRNGQILAGRDQMIRTWTAEIARAPLFSMGDTTVNCVSTGRSNLEVLLEYDVYTYFKTGETDRHRQRLHLSWGIRAVTENGICVHVPKLYMIHISNIESAKEQSVRVYAASSSESRPDAIESSLSGRISARVLSGKGMNEETCFFSTSSVLWIESADGGRHSVIHTAEGSYPAIERLSFFETHYPDLLLRAHISYLINPLHIRSVRRFEVTLSDGIVLSIPQKKYTAFRAALAEWNERIRRS